MKIGYTSLKVISFCQQCPPIFATYFFLFQDYGITCQILFDKLYHHHWNPVHGGISAMTIGGDKCGNSIIVKKIVTSYDLCCDINV